ncbi:MAG: S8 family serine peptidase [bacterium]|nr:S8 family serine peptidase [bacterium]
MAPNDLHLSTLHKTPYGWPLRQLRIPQAHKITRGNKNVVVAVIDLGYTYHPHHEGHLWVNPNPTRGDIHGWDCHDDDASLEYNLHNPDTDYNKGHHAFIVGEVIACAPECRVMAVRVGYQNPDSWWKGIDYAVDNGAKVLIIPHGFISHGTAGNPIPLFYRGTDFSYPLDNPRLRKSLERAYDAGCVIAKGLADNRGRRVATNMPGLEAVFSVGSVNKHNKAANICPSADYAEAATPAGERNTDDETDQCWSTGGHNNYIPFTGGCMASGWAGGIAALVMSRYPHLTNAQVRQVLRNTARGKRWNPQTGWGILDAHKAVSLTDDQLCQRLRIHVEKSGLAQRRGKTVLNVTIKNDGVFDVKKALVVAFNGNPTEPAAPEGTMQNAITLITSQIGHTIGEVRGLHDTRVTIELTGKPEPELWVQVNTLDLHGSEEVDTAKIPLP